MKSLMTHDAFYSSILNTTTKQHKLLEASCMCHQDLIVGIDDNDHIIRGVMRFIELTSG